MESILKSYSNACPTISWFIVEIIVKAAFDAGVHAQFERQGILFDESVIPHWNAHGPVPPLVWKDATS